MSRYVSTDTQHSISQWYNKVQIEVSSLTEWNELSEHLYNTIICQSENPSLFHSLPAKEKELLIKDALKQFSSNDDTLMRRITHAISSTVNESLSRNGLSDRQTSLLSISDYILDKPGNATEIRSQFTKYLNGNIPLHMRCLVWKSCLHTPNLERAIELATKRQQHTREFSGKLKSLQREFSATNASISDTVEELIMECLYLYTEVIFQGTGPRLQHIKLLYPFVIAVLDSPQTSSHIPSARPGVLAKILSMYVSFLQKTPEFIRSDSPTRGAEMWLKEFSLNVTSLIKSHDALLYHFMCGLTSNSEPQLVTCFSQLFKPFIQDMFVGHVQTPLLLFLWDNCFLCLDTPNIQFLPIAAACWLIILKRDIMSVTRFGQIAALLESNSSGISVRIMQEQLRNIMPELKSKPRSQSYLPMVGSSQYQPSETALNTTNISNADHTGNSIRESHSFAESNISEVGVVPNTQTDITNQTRADTEGNDALSSDEATSEHDANRSVSNSTVNMPDNLDTEGEAVALEFWSKIINRFQNGLHKVAHYEDESNN